MSFSTDREALDRLSSFIFDHGFVIDVVFEDGEVIESGLSTCAAVFQAASATADPVHLVLRKVSAAGRYGVFLILMQDDPSCLIVDHSSTDLCQSIFDRWSARAEAV